MLTTAKKSYIAAQLKQLSQVVRLSSSESANNNVGGPAFSPSHLLASPTTAESVGSTGRTTAPSPAAISPAYRQATCGSPHAPNSPVVFSLGEQHSRSSRNPPHPSRPPRGGIGVGPADVAGVAEGPATSPPLSAGAAENEATWSQQTSIADFLIAQLDGLSQLLDHENGPTTVSSPTLSSSGWATARRGSGGSGGSGGGFSQGGASSCLLYTSPSPRD